MKWLSILAFVVLAACGRATETPVVEATPDFTSSRVSIEQFVHAGRTPVAFSQLASALEAVRGGDPEVAADAELHLLALAAPLLESARSRTFDTQVDELALTVWPGLLSASLTDGSGSAVASRDTESVGEFVDRICATELASQCGQVSAEERLLVVRAAVMRNANERMRVALARCLHCESDGPSWHRLGYTLESLDYEAAHYRDLAHRDQTVAMTASARR